MTKFLEKKTILAFHLDQVEIYRGQVGVRDQDVLIFRPTKLPQILRGEEVIIARHSYQEAWNTNKEYRDKF